jgi:hypothetical protein
MSISHDGGPARDVAGDGGYPEDPDVAWIRGQVDLVFGDELPDRDPRRRLARVAATLCVLLFLAVLITLPLTAAR